MDKNTPPPMEDYGSPETDDDSLADVVDQNQNQGYGDRTDTDVTVRTNQGVGAAAAADRAGEGSNFAANQGRQGGEDEPSDAGLHGGQFGEFEDTGTGTDLTERMGEA